jgi:hypothetical protein
MLSRHRRLLHDMESIFRRSDPNALDQARLLHSGAFHHALSQLLLWFRDSSSWHALPRPNSRWISCITEAKREIHYDLLTGQLLIDGKQLGRLPREIVEHPTYACILGTVSGHIRFSLIVFLRVFQRVLDVAPADVRGMDYMTRSVTSGYQVSVPRLELSIPEVTEVNERFYSRGITEI